MGEFKQGGHFDSLYESGKKMGFAKGGAVKDTGNMPAKADGDSQQEKEAGGRAKTRPGYKAGGKKRKMKRGGKTKDGYKKGGLAHASKAAKGGKMKHGGPYKSEPMFGKD